MKHALVIFAFLAVTAMLVFWQPKREIPNVVAPTYSLGQIEIVDTPQTRAQGLSGRAEVPTDYGLLFIFPEKGNYGFWMKDMLVPIDILWIADDGTILGIAAEVQPETYPEAFYPPEPVRYVLETRAGEAQLRGWSVGTVLALPLP